MVLGITDHVWSIGELIDQHLLLRRPRRPRLRRIGGDSSG
jgi:hypothetical protein